MEAGESTESDSRALREKKQEKGIRRRARAHLELLTEENIRRGMGEGRCAAVNLGASSNQRTLPDRRGCRFLTRSCKTCALHCDCSQNLPGSALVVVLTLAIGVGATSAVFSVVDRLLSKPSLPSGRPPGQLWR